MRTGLSEAVDVRSFENRGYSTCPVAQFCFVRFIYINNASDLALSLFGPGFTPAQRHIWEMAETPFANS